MLVSVAVFLVLVSFVGSAVAKAVVNRKLAALPAFTGHVDAVKLQLWRGAVRVEDFILRDRDFPDEEPLVRADAATLRVSWSALFHGKPGGESLIERPQVIAVKREADPPEPESKQEKEAKKEEQKQKVEAAKRKVSRWQDELAKAFPLELSKFEVRNGLVRFVDRSRVPEIGLGLEQLHVIAVNLTNRPTPRDGALPAKLEVTGVTTGNGKLKVTAEADPLAKQPRFKTAFELEQMDLTALNPFLLAYADADVSRGMFELFVEINAADGAYEGYLKPFFRDLDFKNPSDKDKNVAQRVKEKVVSAVTSVLKNDEEEKVATKAPFAGNFSDNQVDVWTTIVNLLRNAFVQGLRGGFEGQPPPKPGH
jgi:uncharacterized protein involved in outer membrane biogenesis